MGQITVIYKIHPKEKKLEELQRFQTDFGDKDSFSNTLRWSAKNTGLAVGGDDRVIRLYKVKSATDFTTPFEKSLELKGGHYEPINCIDISASKKFLISSGNDCTMIIWSLEKRSLIKKMTMADNEGPSRDNFSIKGCCFSPCENYIYMLASKRSGSFVVKYTMDLEPEQVL